jgi:roadblock/LC7 domain-containing protein
MQCTQMAIVYTSGGKYNAVVRGNDVVFCRTTKKLFNILPNQI